MTPSIPEPADRETETAQTPAGLYLHVPFCRRKCRYCDFYSRPVREGELDLLVACALVEMDIRSVEVGRLGTIYLGGGTPSLLGASHVAQLLDGIGRRFDVERSAEITVEANPLDVTEEWASACIEAGANRLSVGVQSVDEGDLRFLGRAHHAPDGPAAVERARRAGVSNMGIDLIYGLPGQTPGVIRDRIRTAVDSCRPEHVSCYQLTYASDTPLGRDAAAGHVTPLAEDAEYDLFMCVHETMAKLGYPAYEVSNFARDARLRARHNSNYWLHVNYIGLGPSAHSFVSPVRSWNVTSFDEYARRLDSGELATEGVESLTREQLATEAVMLALRTTDGLDLGSHGRRYGNTPLETRGEVVERLVGEGLIALEGGALRPSVRGLAVADSIARELT